jgi:hypothetical protein
MRPLASRGTTYPQPNWAPDVTLTSPIKRESKPLSDGIVPDGKWPGMYRLRLPDGSLSAMVNLTRAKDALRWITYRIFRTFRIDGFF